MRPLNGRAWLKHRGEEIERWVETGRWGLGNKVGDRSKLGLPFYGKRDEKTM